VITATSTAPRGVLRSAGASPCDGLGHVTKDNAQVLSGMRRAREPIEGVIPEK